jgi:proteasome assembly chaperone (PAC2) family protein
MRGRPGREGELSMKMFDKISFETKPILLAAWPGMGNVGLIAMDYMRRKLETKLFAEIDMSPYFIPDSIIVKDGKAQLPEIPSSVFHYRKNPDVIVFESNAQVGGRDGIAIIKIILDIAKQFGVPRIYTAAAFAQPMSHASDSQVLCACNNDNLLNLLKEHSVVPMPDGYIAGLNGLLLGVASASNIDAACFLGTIPSYASNLSYPKASLEIVKTMAKLLAIEFDMSELKESVDNTDRQLSAIEERIREYFPSVTQKEPEAIEVDVNDEEVPKYIMDKIERLFEKVRLDKAKANELKNELVRWNLYDLYEHRFLDLFKDDTNRKEK